VDGRGRRGNRGIMINKMPNLTQITKLLKTDPTQISNRDVYEIMEQYRQPPDRKPKKRLAVIERLLRLPHIDPTRICLYGTSMIDMLLTPRHIPKSFPIIAMILMDDRVNPWMKDGLILKRITEHFNDRYAWLVFTRWVTHPQTILRWQEEIDDIKLSRKDRRILADWMYLWNNQIPIYLEQRLSADRDMEELVGKYLR
jgi:hypothetical protein